MRHDETIGKLRSCATSARLDAQGFNADQADTIRTLADAVDLAADLIEQQWRFCLMLRDGKQDAPYHE